MEFSCALLLLFCVCVGRASGAWGDNSRKAAFPKQPLLALPQPDGVPPERGLHFKGKKCK